MFAEQWLVTMNGKVMAGFEKAEEAEQYVRKWLVVPDIMERLTTYLGRQSTLDIPARGRGKEGNN